MASERQTLFTSEERQHLMQQCIVVDEYLRLHEQFKPEEFFTLPWEDKVRQYASAHALVMRWRLPMDDATGPLYKAVNTIRVQNAVDEEDVLYRQCDDAISAAIQCRNKAFAMLQTANRWVATFSPDFKRRLEQNIRDATAEINAMARADGPSGTPHTDGTSSTARANGASGTALTSVTSGIPLPNGTSSTPLANGTSSTPDAGTPRSRPAYQVPDEGLD